MKYKKIYNPPHLQPAAEESGYGAPAAEYGAPSSGYGHPEYRSVGLGRETTPITELMSYIENGVDHSQDLTNTHELTEEVKDNVKEQFELSTIKI